MNSGLFKTDWATVGDAVLTGVVMAVIAALYGVVTTTGFDVLTADWGTILGQMLNIGFISAVTILAKDLLSTNNGSLLGIGTAN